MKYCIFIATVALCLFPRLAKEAEPDQPHPEAGGLAETHEERGYRLLTRKAYLPADFDQQVFDELWQTWEEPLRSHAAAATPAQRRRMAFSRYGLTENPENPDGVALQYVDDGRGGWVMNCLACHGGQVGGRAFPGLPNSRYALQTLTEEVLQTKLRLGKPLGHMELGSLAMPLGGSNGTTNAVMFGVALMAHRDPDLNLHKELVRPEMTHHDLDAPPWWNVKKKTHLYADGFVPRGHRALMQFLLVPANGAEKFRLWEDEYADILAWILSLEPPPYPFLVDRGLASAGQSVFNAHCAKCHGTYGNDETYPGVTVPIDVVGTDRVRLDAMTPEGRRRYLASWFNGYDLSEARLEPAGYIAPPLDGIWASAPYLHNGSVPTLWHLLRPSQRPQIWFRSETGYDEQRVGLEVVEFPELPETADTPKRRREYFETRLAGKSAQGHPFPDELSEAEKQAVLEYLKTL